VTTVAKKEKAALLVGRAVKLVRDIHERGLVFPKGLQMRISRGHRGLFYLLGPKGEDGNPTCDLHVMRDAFELV